jgi:hypothetical protein
MPPTQEVYKFTRCKVPLPIAVMEAKGVPLPDEDVELLEANLRWSEILVRGCCCGDTFLLW